MEEENNCPKSGCGKPETSHRWHAGKRLSICGDAHSWDPKAVAEQRAKAKAAEKQESAVELRQKQQLALDRLRNGTIIPRKPGEASRRAFEGIND